MQLYLDFIYLNAHTVSYTYEYIRLGYWFAG